MRARGQAWGTDLMGGDRHVLCLVCWAGQVSQTPGAVTRGLTSSLRGAAAHRLCFPAGVWGSPVPRAR